MWRSVAVLLAILGSNGAIADDPVDRKSRGTLTLSVENDLFGKGSDKHYTHGGEITYVSDTLPAAFSRLPFYQPGDSARLVWSLGQQMYTPTDISEPALIESDRPYAGWLFTSFGILNEHLDGVRHVDKLELILGLVGPDSGAEDLQREVHRLTDSTYPAGWDNQLENEVTADLQYQRQWVLPLIGDHVDIVPQVTTMLGSSQRFAGTGATLRFGAGLSSDFGPPLIRPSASGSHHFKADQTFYWYVFVGAHGRYVGHNIFLDGNRDGESHSVERREWVGDVQAGVVMGWSNWRLTLTNIIRSREFEGQDQPDEFGALSLTYRH